MASAGQVVGECLALPLRIGPSGKFKTVATVPSVMSIFGAMAATGPGAWPHAPWFSLEPLFAQANMDKSDHPGIADALNLALDKLGVPTARVVSVHTVRATSLGTRNFDITLMLDGEVVAHERLQA